MRLSSIILILMGITISGCGPGKIFGPTIPPTATSSQTPTGTASPTATPTSTRTPTATPKPEWQKDLETQDPEDIYFIVVNGQPVIDLYNTADIKEAIVLDPASAEIIPVNDPVRPNIITITAAKDMEGNLYLFNPDRGWFPLTLGIAPTIEQFSLVSRADFPVILAYLRSRPSVVSPDALPVWTTGRMTARDAGQGKFVVSCPHSCVVAASIKIQEQERDPHIVIWELKMKNNERGYLLGWEYDPVEMTGPIDVFLERLAEQSGAQGNPMTFLTAARGDPQNGGPHPYLMSTFQQPGYLDAIDAFIATQIIPPELEIIILPQIG